MQLLDDVYINYPATLAARTKVKPGTATPDLVAIGAGLPSLFRELLTDLSLPQSNYKVWGGYGQTNFNFARIPWVAICDRRVTTSTERGYYIVLLFREPMDGCFLSLNQGVTQFKKAFGTDTLAAAQIEVSALRCLQLLDVADGYVGGRIDLGASKPMGEGYERGAIVSKWYARATDVGADDFQQDLAYLLGLYGRLIARVGPDLSLQVSISEDAFQGAAAALARSQRALPQQPEGPLPPPPQMTPAGTGGYRRDPNVCASAQRKANFRCEVDSEHRTFISRSSKSNFVESHHLIPMSSQGKFTVSLDVGENVLALCPTCHRFLHHGLPKEIEPILRELLAKRTGGLLNRGILIDGSALLQIYKLRLADCD